MKRMAEGTTDQLVETLRKAGFKATAGRIAILTLFSSEKQPLSIADVADALAAHSLDETTIYRALEAMADAGLLNRVHIDRSRTYYELAAREHHHHVVCERCGTVEDVQECSIAALERSILAQSKEFATISHHSLEFFGTCQRCNK